MRRSVAASGCVLALVLSGCAASAPTPVAQSQTAAPVVVGTTPLQDAALSELIDVCVGEAETGSIVFDRNRTIYGQRPSDRTWLVAIPVEFEALREGEQRCVISGEPGTFSRSFVEYGRTWAEGELAMWLDADKMWFD